MKKFSIYKVISILAFIALIFILALPNFFDINKKQETEQCIKNMKVVYSAAEQYLQAEKQDFSGTSSDLERLGYLNKAYECPSEAPGDKYQIKIVAETGLISVRCINEINSSPDLTANSFEDFVYFLNILKFHEKPTSNFIYELLNDEVKTLLAEHEAYSTSLFDTRTVLDWDKFIANLNNRRREANLKEIWALFSEDSKSIIENWHRVNNPLTVEQKYQLTDEINKNIIINHEFSKELITSLSLDKEGHKLNSEGYSNLNQIEKQRLNHLVLEALFPYEFQVSSKYNYPSDDLKELLVDDINRILANNSLNDQKFINMIDVSGNTIKKIKEQPNSRVDILLVNRLLLQDAYPSLLVKYIDQYSDHRLPDMN